MCIDGNSATDRALTFEVRGKRHTALLRTPPRPAERPALLIIPGGTRQDALEHEDHRRVPDIFTAAGHYVASFDLPNHGDQVDEFGEDLAGMARAMEAGHNVFAEAGEVGRALIDEARREGLGEHGVVLFGTSRGGLAVLHIMSGDTRVLACAVNAPLMYIPEPREFAHLADSEVVRQANAMALVDRLADRHVFIDIGTSDPRVGSGHSFEFHAALCAVSKHVQPVLFTAPGESHGLTYPMDSAYQAAAGFLLSRYAAQTKHAR